MRKVKVTPKQMAYYRSVYPGNKMEVLQRMIKEFKLGLGRAKDVYEDFPESFQIVETNAVSVAPAWEGDPRSSIFIPEDMIRMINELMTERLDGKDPYEHFPEITQKDRDFVFRKVREEFRESSFFATTTRSLEVLRDTQNQWPLGIYPVVESKAETMTEMASLLRERADSGESIGEIVSNFLKSAEHWADDQKAISYAACAEVLYEEVQRVTRRLRETSE